MTSMMYHQIVITAGISLFSSHNIFRQWTDELDIFFFERTNPMPGSGLDLKTAFEKWQAACEKTDLSRMAESHPGHISAEYSLLHALSSGGRLGKKPRIVIIHTDTLGGKAVAHLLKRLLASDFNTSVSLTEVADIDPADRIRLRQSLGGFMEATASALEAADPSYTCFAPVGGYKVMTSLGYLAGAYMGFPTAYLHEDSQALHEIPAVPVRIAHEELREAAPLLCRLKTGDIEWENLTEDERSHISRFPWLFDRLESLTGLNAFVRFLMSRPENRALFQPKVEYAPDEKPLLKNGVTGPFIRQQVEELLKKLEAPETFSGELHHEKTFSLTKPAGCALYKGASNGRHVFRAVYRFDASKQTLFIQKIWTDHDTYEREAAGWLSVQG